MSIIPDEQKKVIFDSDVYINLLKNSFIEDIIQWESNKNVFAYAFPWVILELMQYSDDKALDVLKKHCYDTINQNVRLIADPIAQVYKEIYGSESKLCATLLDEIYHSLTSNSKQKDVANLLKQKGQLFSDDFPLKIKVNQKNKNVVKRVCAEHIVNKCIEINSQEENKKTIDKNEATNWVIKNFDIPLSYFYDLLLRKATRKNVNKENLCHDLRDWHLIFYGGIADFFVVTEDRVLWDINPENIMSLEIYRNKILSN